METGKSTRASLEHLSKGVRIDIIPAGAAFRARQSLVWPLSGIRTSLIRFEDVFKDSTFHSFENGLSLKVISLPVLALASRL